MAAALSPYYSLILFLHLTTMVVAFGMSALMHDALHQMRTALRAPRALEAAAVPRRLGPLMPLVALAFFATGAALASARTLWSAPWVGVSIAALVLMQLLSLAIIKPRLQAIGRALAQAGDQAVSAVGGASVRDPLLWSMSRMQAGIALAIMFDMIVQPALIGSVAAIAAGIVLSVAVAMAGDRQPAASGALPGASAAES